MTHPGCRPSLQTFGSFANFHPHIHALVTNGVVTPEGEFLPLPRWTPQTLEEVFRRLYPLLSPRCQVEMVVVSVITDPRVLDRILEQRRWGRGHDPFAQRAPPSPPSLERIESRH